MDPLKQWVSDAAAAQFVEEQLQSLVEVRRSRSQKLAIEMEPDPVDGRFQAGDSAEEGGEEREEPAAASPSLAKTPAAHAAVEVCFQHLDSISRALDRHVNSQTVAKPSYDRESSSKWKSGSRKVAASDIAFGSGNFLAPKEEVNRHFVRAMSSKKLHALSKDVAQLVDSHSEHIRQMQQLEADVVAAQRQKEDEVEREDLANKRRKRMAFSRNINLCTEVLSVYFGKTCRTPIMSIERDESLLFDLLEPSKAGRRPDAKAMRARVMQIKVRVNAIVNSIVSNELPDEVYAFMCSLLDDGNTMPENFLYQWERERLTFDENDQTVAMLPVLNDSDFNAAPPPPEDKNVLREVFSRIGSFFLSVAPWAGTAPATQHEHGFSRPPDTISIGNGQSVDVRKVKMLIQNFVVIKVLINVVLLSPWSVGAAAVPKKTRRDWRSILRMVSNYRMVASVMYKLLRLLDPSLPQIAHQAQPSSPSLKGGRGSSLKKSSLYDFSSPSQKDSKTTTTSSSSSSSSKYASNSPVRSDDSKTEKFWVEECLIGRRRLLQPLEATMQLLLPEDPFYLSAQPLLDEWLGTTAKKLSAWMTGLVSRLVRQKLRREQPSLVAQLSSEPSPAASVQGSRPGTRDAVMREAARDDLEASVPERELPLQIEAFREQQEGEEEQPGFWGGDTALDGFPAGVEE